MALGSKAMVGIFICSAAAIPGPKHNAHPKTTSGLNSGSDACTLDRAGKSSNVRSGSAGRLFERSHIDQPKPESGLRNKAISMPRAVPTNSTSAP